MYSLREGYLGDQLPATANNIEISIFKKISVMFLILFFKVFIWLHWVLVVAHGISFPDQGLNPSPLHCHQEGPIYFIFK